MLKHQKVYSALSRVAKTGLLNTPVDDLVMVVLAVWHEGFVPEVSWANKLDPQSKLVVGYMAEFLAGFNVLCTEERSKLLEFSAKLKPLHPTCVDPDNYRDELATEWGLEHDLAAYFEYFSHFQTRHYGHHSKYKRPSSNFAL
ncbi:MAG: hypothetical protein MI864_06390 [Pseudomonadales bacterium]|nr:hypothetical protein [Pseudomonadales bacterium]